MVARERRVVLCPEEDVKPGSVKAVQAGARKLVVARASDGSLSVMRDRCPHLGAPLSAGRIQSMVKGEDVGDHHVTTDEVLVCPWHRFEYNLSSGVCEADPHNFQVRVYEVDVEDGMIVVTL